MAGSLPAHKSSLPASLDIGIRVRYHKHCSSLPPDHPNILKVPCKDFSCTSACCFFWEPFAQVVGAGGSDLVCAGLPKVAGSLPAHRFGLPASLGIGIGVRYHKHCSSFPPNHPCAHALCKATQMDCPLPSLTLQFFAQCFDAFLDRIFTLFSSPVLDCLEFFVFF